MSNDIYQRGKKFIRKSKKVHQNKYDYSKVDYVNARTNVTIICPIHGDFEQWPDKHLNRKHGCPKCGGTKKKTTDEFVTNAKQVHGEKYEYMLVNYKGKNEKIQIVCHEHGIFKQTPKDHLDGCGCPKCGGRAHLTQQDFVMRSKKQHGNRYDYSLAKYTRDRDKVTIICPIHGKFEQAPIGHMRGQGCPTCNKPGGYCEKLFNENEELKTHHGRLYLVEFTDTLENIQFLKVGITQSSIKDRFSRGYSVYDYEVLLDKEFELYEAFLLEQHILRSFVSAKFKPDAPFAGRNECFTLQYKDQIIKTILTS